MLKFVKSHLSTIGHIEIYPIISFLIFFLFFLVMLVWVFKTDKKFINKIYKQIKAGKKELFVVDDKLGTPTYTVDFANSILKVMDSGYYGLYNQVCEGSCSRFDVAEEFINLLGLKDTITLTKVTSDYFNEEYFAPRPASEKLINVKLSMRGINYMRDWRTCLSDYSQEYKKDYYGK